jgi:hypothetical protein
MAGYGRSQSYVRHPEPTLTFEAVTREFDRVPAKPEPTRDD